jgi:hypothetical protein
MIADSNVKVSIYGSKKLAAINRSVPDPENVVLEYVEGIYTDLNVGPLAQQQGFEAENLSTQYRLVINVSRTDFLKIKTGMFVSIDYVKHPDTKSFINAEVPKEQFLIKYVNPVYTASKTVTMTISRLPAG